MSRSNITPVYFCRMSTPEALISTSVACDSYIWSHLRDSWNFFQEAQTRGSLNLKGKAANVYIYVCNEANKSDIDSALLKILYKYNAYWRWAGSIPRHVYFCRSPLCKAIQLRPRASILWKERQLLLPIYRL